MDAANLFELIDKYVDAKIQESRHNIVQCMNERKRAEKELKNALTYVMFYSDQQVREYGE